MPSRVNTMTGTHTKWMISLVWFRWLSLYFASRVSIARGGVVLSMVVSGPCGAVMVVAEILHRGARQAARIAPMSFVPLPSAARKRCFDPVVDQRTRLLVL